MLPFPEDFSVEQSVMGLAGPTEVDPRTGLTKPLDTPAMSTTGLTLPPLQDVTLASEVDLTTPMVTAQAASMVMGTPTPAGTPVNTGAIIMAPAPTGRPPGYPSEALMAETDANVQYGVPLPITSIISDGTPLVRVTCSRAHGLVLNNQILVTGAGDPLADGTFSVTPLTATVFTYGCYSPVPPGSILGPETTIVTAQIGLPRDFPAVPQTGLPQTPKSKDVQ